MSTTTVKTVLIPFYAGYYDVPVKTLDSIVSCESGYDMMAINDRHTAKKNPEYSVGVAQINLMSSNHKDITLKQAQNPFFALNYLASGIKYGTDHWTCQGNNSA